MLIRIINGTFGHREKDEDGNYSVFVQPKTSQDPPFEVDPDVAERLIAGGIAVEYVPSAVATALQDAEDSGEGKNLSDGEKPVEGTEGANLDPDQLQGMTVAELKRLADDMGLDASDCKKKEDYIVLISAEDVYAEDDGKAPPELGAEAPVV